MAISQTSGLRKVLSKGPLTSQQLFRKTRGDLAGRLVKSMRKANDEGDKPPFLCAKGINNDGLRAMVYWVPPEKMGKSWWRAFALLQVNPEKGEVV